MEMESSAATDDLWQSRSDMDDRRTLKGLRLRADNGETDLGPLIEGLDLLHSLYFKIFRETDAKAVRYQRWYRGLALGATLTGAFAVFAALYQLADGEVPWAAYVEVALAISSLLIVVAVIGLELKQKWLLKRVQAERLRLCKFDALLDGSLWSPSERELLRARLERDIGLMQLEGEDKIEEWAHNHPIPKARPTPMGTRRSLAGEFGPLLPPDAAEHTTRIPE